MCFTNFLLIFCLRLSLMWRIASLHECLFRHLWSNEYYTTSTLSQAVQVLQWNLDFLRFVTGKNPVHRRMATELLCTLSQTRLSYPHYWSHFTKIELSKILEYLISSIFRSDKFWFIFTLIILQASILTEINFNIR